MRKANRWHAAIRCHLSESTAPLTLEQIWECMEAAEFKHESKVPRATLRARIAEMVAEGELSREGLSYCLITVEAQGAA